MLLCCGYPKDVWAVFAEISCSARLTAAIEALIRGEDLGGVVSRGYSEENKASNFRSEPIAASTHSPSCAIFDGLNELAGNPTKPVTADDIAQTRRNVREPTKVGEREIHEAVLSCTRARRQFLNSVPITKPTRH